LNSPTHAPCEASNVCGHSVAAGYALTSANQKHGDSVHSWLIWTVPSSSWLSGNVEISPVPLSARAAGGNTSASPAIRATESATLMAADRPLRT